MKIKKIAEEKKRRMNGIFAQDRWLSRVLQISAFTITPLAVGIAVFLYKEFATISYVDAGDEQMEIHCNSNAKQIGIKLDNISDNLDNYREELLVRVADRWTKRDHERWEDGLNKRLNRIEKNK